MKQEKLTEDFATQCFDSRVQIYSSTGANWFLLPELVFSKYTKKQFIKILKDPVWIKVSISSNYFSYDSTGDDLTFKQKISSILMMIGVMFQVDHSYTDLIVKYGDGIILREAMKSCEDYKLKALSLRGIKSKDFRARKQAVKFCPVNRLKPMLKDSKKDVRAAAIERLGIHNVADELINDPAVDIRLSAAIVLERLDVIESILESESEKVSSYTAGAPWVSQCRISKIISKLPKKKLLYNIDLKDSGIFVSKMVEAKLYNNE